MTKQEVIDAVKARGPDRVMISPDEAVPSRRAREEHGVVSDVILVRDDGWMLAAPRHLFEAAREMGEGSWEWVWYRGDKEPVPFLEGVDS